MGADGSRAFQDDTVEAALKEIETNMNSIVSGQTDAYKTGCDIWAKAFSLAPESRELMWPMWLIWVALTDWVEMKPEEATTALDLMGRAAREWLSLEDSAQRKDYFDRWFSMSSATKGQACEPANCPLQPTAGYAGGG